MFLDFSATYIVRSSPGLMGVYFSKKSIENSPPRLKLKIFYDRKVYRKQL